MNYAEKTRAQIIMAIEQMIAAGDSINISAVAERCGVSHSLIYNRYPDLKERIKEMKATQKVRQKTEDNEALISTLLAKNKLLKEKAKGISNIQAEEGFRSLLVHVQEIYSMYDQLLEDRNGLAQRLKHSK